MRFSFLLFMTVVLCSTMSCGSSQDTAENKPKNVDTPDAPAVTKHVVLDMEITKRKNKQEEIELKKQSVVEGRLAESKIIYPPEEISKLLVQLLDEKQEVIEELVIKEPYLQTLKKYDEGEEVDNHDDEVRRSKFSVQFNQNSAIKSIKIFKMKDDKTVEIFHEYFMR